MDNSTGATAQSGTGTETAAQETSTQVQGGQQEQPQGQSDQTQQAKADKAEAKPQAQAPSWRDEVSGGDADLRKFLESYTSAPELGKALLGFRKKLSTAIVPPGKDATPEEIAEFRKKVGVPEKEDGYTFAPPEGIEEPDQERAGAVAKAFMQAAHKHNVPQAAFADLVGIAYKIAAAHQAEQAKSNAGAIQAAQDALRGEWRGDFDKNLGFASTAYGAFGDAEFRHLAETVEVAPGVKLGNHPAMLRFAAKVGRATGEERLEFLGMDDKQRETAQADYDRLTEEFNEAQRLGDSAKAKRIYAQRSELSKKLHGTAPADGRAH